MAYKSKGEEAIAEVLKKYNVRFVYEHPILVIDRKENDKAKLRIWYPDFWLPDYAIIIEYFGMDGDKHYHKGRVEKQDTYRECDIDCIPVYPKTIEKDLKSYLLVKIKTLLNDRVRHFDNRNKVLI